MAVDTIVVTVRIPVAMQQQLDAVALKSPQLKIATEPWRSIECYRLLR
jgi:hypothetical protein